MFGPVKHPEVVSAVLISAPLDWAAMTIAAALAEPEQEAHIVPPQELLRQRP